MKIRAKVTTILEFDFKDPRVTEDIARQMAIAMEAGWRVGAMKDMATVQEVYRQQFGQAATVASPDVHFDVTFIP